MTINKGSDIIFNINFTDSSGTTIRVSDTNKFMLRFYTTNATNYVECSYIDGTFTNIVVSDDLDLAFVKSDDLSNLESGVICYLYSFRVANSNFSDGYYDEIKIGCTNFYLK